MKHFAAYALLVLGGNTHPTAADVEKVLTAAGVKGEEGKVAALI
jgi:large subunit ribosomal protein LP2